MNKSMYSLMLMDGVIRAVDREAYLRNTNRSNVVNQVLAEYFNVKTPEMMIREVFDDIADMIRSETFQIQINPTDYTLSIRSSLDYKYRPTIRYSLELFRVQDQEIGRLTAYFRTQSPMLSLELSNFFKLWIGVEEEYLKKFLPKATVEYSVDLCKFRRTFAIPGEKKLTNKELGASISGYIQMFDTILKKYLSGEIRNFDEMAEAYNQFIQSGIQVI